MILKIALMGYTIIYIQNAVHELAHLAAAAFMGVGVERVVIGCDRWAVKSGRLTISPIPLGGYVEVDCEGLVRTGPLGILLFFESGSVAVLLGSLLLDRCWESPASSLALMASVVSLVVSNFPCWASTDGARMWRMWKSGG